MKDNLELMILECILPASQFEEEPINSDSFFLAFHLKVQAFFCDKEVLYLGKIALCEIKYYCELSVTCPRCFGNDPSDVTVRASCLEMEWNCVKKQRFNS